MNDSKGSNGAASDKNRDRDLDLRRGYEASLSPELNESLNDSKGLRRGNRDLNPLKVSGLRSKV